MISSTGLSVAIRQIDLAGYSGRMSPASSTTVKQSGTRVRLVESAAELFSREGFGATGIKAVLAAAAAPYGSLYHFFPGGKEEIRAASLTHGGERWRGLAESVVPAG